MTSQTGQRTPRAPGALVHCGAPGGVSYFKRDSHKQKMVATEQLDFWKPCHMRTAKVAGGAQSEKSIWDRELDSCS